MITATRWFKRKKYGWGWTPATWQGWLVLAVYLVFIVRMFRHIDAQSHSGSDTLIGFFIPLIVSTAILLIVCYLTGESPRWQWGNEEH